MNFAALLETHGNAVAFLGTSMVQVILCPPFTDDQHESHLFFRFLLSKEPTIHVDVLTCADVDFSWAAELRLVSPRTAGCTGDGSSTPPACGNGIPRRWHFVTISLCSRRRLPWCTHNCVQHVPYNTVWRCPSLDRGGSDNNPSQCRCTCRCFLN